MLDDLRGISGLRITPPQVASRPGRLLLAAIAIIIIAVAAIAVRHSIRTARVGRADESIARAERLLKENNFP